MAEEHTELTLFEQLEKIRKEKGISLEEISKETRIPVKHLISIEKGDILSIPKVYDKLFFKTYLKALEIPEKDYYEQFLECRNQLRQEKTTTFSVVSPPTDNKETPFNYKNLLVILPVLLVVFVILLLIINTKDIEPPKTDSITEINIQNIAHEIEQKAKSKNDSLEQNKFIDKKLSLNIESLKKTWLRVVIDKKDTTEYLLERGTKIDLSADRFFEFLIGRADGIKIYLNKKTLAPLGKSGEVIQYMLIDSTGIVKQRNVFPKIKRE